MQHVSFSEEKKNSPVKSLLSLFHYLWKLFGKFFKYTEGSKNGNIERLVKFLLFLLRFRSLISFNYNDI